MKIDREAIELNGSVNGQREAEEGFLLGVDRVDLERESLDRNGMGKNSAMNVNKLEFKMNSWKRLECLSEKNDNNSMLSIKEDWGNSLRKVEIKCEGVSLDERESFLVEIDEPSLIGVDRGAPLLRVDREASLLDLDR
jgi:hypothetical protein